MKRRRLVALISVLSLATLGVLALIVLLVITRTSYGENRVRDLIARQLAGGVKGTVYLGHISGGFLTGVTIDSLAIRDEGGELFVSAAKVTVSYDPRDLVDRRVLLSHVDVLRPYVHIRQYEDGSWNYKRIFPSKGASGPKAPGLSFGDYVVARNVRVSGATYLLSMPWHPDDTLHGARRDSALRVAVSRTDKVIRKEKEGYVRTWRWTNGYVVASSVRLADPDSVGRRFVVDTLGVDEFDPPFHFRNVRAVITHLGDSIWIQAPHFDLPGSTGHASGKVFWGNDLPVRYSVHVWGDSVSLRDVAWVYPTLPTTGGGRMELDIHNERDLHVMDYALSRMDVRTTGSRLIGSMTFGVGAPVLVVKDLNLQAAPVDFDLLRALNGKPFPVDWQGTLNGTLAARGGPVNRFVVDDARMTFTDAHVRGAVSRFSGRGGLDILYPALTAFRGFKADVASLDLRTIEHLYPNFPRLGGTISGVATLDSSWLDVRFSNADVFHHDGPAEPTHVTGTGRITYGEQFMTYDVTAQAQPLSLTTLARSYPGMPLQGMLTGPLRIKGTTEALQLTTLLSGAAGTLSYDGVVDVYPTRYGARGTGTFAEFEPARLLTTPALRAGAFNGHFDVDLAGSALADLAGRASLSLDRSEYDGLRIFPSQARVRFADGRVYVDSSRIETIAATVSAHGALGITRGTTDSLRFSLLVDSLGGLRRYFPAVAGQEADSLGGTLAASGVASGSLDSLDVRGTVTGNSIFVQKDRGKSLAGEFALTDVLRNPRGRVAMRLDTLVIAGISVDTVGGALTLRDRESASFSFGALSDNGPTLHGAGEARLVAGGTTLRLDSLALNVDDRRWRLLHPAMVRRDSLGIAIDTVLLADGKGGRAMVVGTVPRVGASNVTLTADSVALGPMGTLLQLPVQLGGWGALVTRATGTQAQPVISVQSSLHDVAYGSMKLERVTGRADYANRRSDAQLALTIGGRTAVTGTLSAPMDITLFSAHLLDDSLHATIRADSADLSVIEAISPALRDAQGRLVANLDIGGTWKKPHVGGRLVVQDGDVSLQSLGIRLREVQADLAFSGDGDSLAIRRITARSGVLGDTAGVSGFIVYRNLDDPVINLRLDARTFHAIDKRSLATMDVSTTAEGMRLTGRMTDASLTGGLVVNRGTIYIPDPELSRKQVADLSSQGFFTVDSADARARALVPDAPSKLVQNLRIQNVSVALGDEVWLRSRQANIKLGGTLSVQRSEEQRRGGPGFGLATRDTTAQYKLALSGELKAERGTYTLDLGVVQREFVVQSGVVDFFGTPDLNPKLDITALHQVKQYGRQDIGVRVRLTGFLYPSPVVTLESNENFAISQSDLVSYLVTGEPSFQIAGTADATKTAANVLLPTASAIVANGLRSTIGGWVDQFQFQAGATSAELQGSKLRGTARDFLFGARLNGEKQVGTNLFLSVSAGLCSLDRTQQQADQSGISGFADALGGKIEWRFSPLLSLSAAREPPSSALVCGNRALRGFVPTPQQWGISLARSWRF
ncbi:MAG: hypothetical protein JWO05_672 [Gemmatimonadetes bacterium]|nr:hypothetical protein [Gemmatimonadota bacterium]